MATRGQTAGADLRDGGPRVVAAATSASSAPPDGAVGSQQHASFTLPLSVTIRPCTQGDLQGLEWYGLFSHHREIFGGALARQARGDTLMLLAVADGFPIGQVFIDFDARPGEPRPVALLWALRVYPFLQGHGLGARLLAAAEEAIRARGGRVAEIGVEKDNPGARRLYERMGYRLHRELREELVYTGADGAAVRVPLDEWMLRKELPGDPEWQGDGR